ncbi:hypothetical protein FRB94_003585 [Tulasnella sp. JGI-2019a]|nr:hypothetical protein FRB93_002584 [Tulasnella sp. JGI-2019a]KAG9013145.1 hypothetical protein FRB94_003585 [Tulasnella sp. JGI-2019a]KAG9032180.1 hypothetical protein FRB95_001807 [Tulasnella sp. JGI-2019a]
MKPPSEVAMNQAMKILMASIAEQNSDSLSGSAVSTPTTKLLLRREAVETLQKAVTKATIREIAAVSHAINANTAVHKLPAELLIKIWSLVLSSYSRLDQEHRPGKYYRTLHVLARVSKSWANILRAETQLWTFINAGDSWKAVSIALARSADLPLTIVVPNPRIVGEFPGPRDPVTGRPGLHWLSNASHVEKFCQHMHRWKNVSLCTPAHRTLWSHLQADSSAAPNLEELVVGYRSLQSETIGPIFGGGAPNLQSLELRSSTITVKDASLFTTLRVIKLVKVSLHMSPSEFVVLLRRCPDLFSLTLIDSDVADAGDSRFEPLVLKSLRKIHLEKLSLCTCIFILSHIDTPELDSIIIVSSDMPEYPAREPSPCDEDLKKVSTSYVVSSARSLLRSSRGPHMLTILLLPRRFTFHSPNAGDVGLSVSIETMESRHYLRWALKLVEDELPEEVNLSLSLGGGYHCTSPDLLQLLPEMRSTVTTLHFHANLEGVNSLLKLLAKPSQSASKGEEKEWLLPRLTALYFTGTRNFSEGLVRLVNRRFAGSQAQLHSAPTGGLRYIFFDDVDVEPAALEKLYTVLGKERVLWGLQT